MSKKMTLKEILDYMPAIDSPEVAIAIRNAIESEDDWHMALDELMEDKERFWQIASEAKSRDPYMVHGGDLEYDLSRWAVIYIDQNLNDEAWSRTQEKLRERGYEFIQEFDGQSDDEYLFDLYGEMIEEVEDEEDEDEDEDEDE